LISQRPVIVYLLIFCWLLLPLACAESDSAIGGFNPRAGGDAGGEPDLTPDLPEPEPDLPEPEPDLPEDMDLPDSPDLTPDLTEEEEESLLGQPCADAPAACSFEGLICAIDRRDGAQVEVTCALLDDLDGALGEPCALDLACQAGLCLEDWLWTGCSAPCAADADCPLPGWRCQERALLEGGQGLTRVCVPPDPGACQTDADCPDGSACLLRPDRDNASLVPVCLPAPEGGELGDACQDNAACASGICLDGACAALCRPGEGCDLESQRCDNTTWTQDGLSGQFDLCRTLPETDCLRTQDCAAQGQVCGEIRFLDPVRLLCVDPLGEGEGLGAPCEGALSRNEACEGRLCLRNITDSCTATCVTSADCEGFAQPHICTDFRFSGQVVRMCAPGCADDATCARPGQQCVLNRNLTDDRFDFICRTPTGDDPPTGDCSQTVDCDHGICLTRRNGEEILERICTLPCDDDGDCPAELPVCGTANITTPGGADRQTLRICNRD
jgi:hypothetical protein